MIEHADRRGSPFRAGGSIVVRRLVPGLLALWLLALLGGCASDGGNRVAERPEVGDPSQIPDAIPRVEPRSKYGNPESYVVFGKRYRTRDSSLGFRERGLASWYGRQFHGRKTSSGERYDMYGMTAAHKTLPLPTYVRVTNLENGKTAVVKVNDRGPFHGPRVIDLSYAAASKLGVVRKGTAMVDVQALDPSRPGSDPGPDVGPFLAATYAKSADTRSRAPTRSEGRTKPREVARRVGTKRPAPTEPATARAMESALAATGAKRVDGEAEKATDGVGAAAPARAALAAVQKPPSAPRPDAGDGRKGLYLQVGAFGDRGNAERLQKRLLSHLAGVLVQSSAASGPTLYKVQVGPFGSEKEATRAQAKLATLGVDESRRVWN